MNLEKAIDFYNAKRKEGETKMTQALLAREAFGNEKPDEMRVSKIMSGKLKKLNPEWIDNICRVLGCDPNFILDWPSVYDKLWKTLNK